MQFERTHSEMYICVCVWIDVAVMCLQFAQRHTNFARQIGNVLDFLLLPFSDFHVICDTRAQRDKIDYEQNAVAVATANAHINNNNNTFILTENLFDKVIH